MIAFNKYYNKFNILSLTLVIVSLLFLIFKGLNFGIDFKGGTLIELRSSDAKINISSLRDNLKQMNLGDISVKNFGNETDFLIWGPSNVKFAGFKIDNWGRWYLVMGYSMFSQISYSIVSSTLRPFISNVIRDYKTPIEDKGSLIRAQYLVSVYTFY